jgi:phosphate-selective porin OprO/OprP
MRLGAGARRVACVAAATALLSPLCPYGIAVAADTTLDSLLDTLRANGTLTESQYRTLSAGDAAASDAGFPTVTLGGRIMADMAIFDEDAVTLGDGTELRRARVEIEAALDPAWWVELNVDAAKGEAGVKDALVARRLPGGGRLAIGQQKEPFSLEEQTSSRYTTFMERALPNALVPGRAVGIGVRTGGGRWSGAGGVFGEGFDENPPMEGEEGWAATVRGTTAPLLAPGRVVHLGAAASYRHTDDSRVTSFESRPESHLTDVTYLCTGPLPAVSATLREGLEAAAVVGPASLQAEYVHAGLDRRGPADVTFAGWYVFGSWFPTGEGRPYKPARGTFGRVTPRRPGGAWEVAVRHSVLDLSDGAVSGGTERNTTVGMNWYATPRVRVMANYVIVNNDAAANHAGMVVGDDDPRLFQMRVQADF